MNTASKQRLPFVRLGLLTAAAVAIHGYHLGVEDAEIYIPAAKRLLNPNLYPFADEFFLSHGHLSLFSPILVWTARLTHLSMDWTISLWFIASLFAMLAACWALAAASFESPRARWGSLLVITAVLTMPATNTGLLLMDPYLTARSFSTPVILFALVFFLQRRYALAGVACFAAAAIHSQMTVCLVGLGGVLWVAEKLTPAVRQRIPVMASLAGIIPTGFHFSPAQGPYREALYARDFFFLSNWSWYHWVGLLAPIAILWWMWRRSRDGQLRGTTAIFERVCLALIPFGLIAIAVAVVFRCSHTMDMFARLQPLRAFHLITLIFMIYLGGLLGEYLAKGRKWVLAAIFVPLAAGMFLVARVTYPSSPHVELPWLKTSSNAWVNTMLWIRYNTPESAVFAVDSRYFKDQGVDVHGFRSISERSMLADYFKDGGVAAMFPNLATEWKQMSNATYGLNHFESRDFIQLASRYPVTWTVIHGSAPDGMSCPYQQRGYAVCKIPAVPKPSLN
jgi:hypothetical protein